jgi:hypothetical protein
MGPKTHQMLIRSERIEKLKAMTLLLSYGCDLGSLLVHTGDKLSVHFQLQETSRFGFLACLYYVYVGHMT